MLQNEFTVIYDIDIFENESTICIKNREGEAYDFGYFSEEIIDKVLKLYPDTKKIYKSTDKPKMTRAIKCLELKFLDEDPLNGFEDGR